MPFSATIPGASRLCSPSPKIRRRQVSGNAPQIHTTCREKIVSKQRLKSGAPAMCSNCQHWRLSPRPMRSILICVLGLWADPRMRVGVGNREVVDGSVDFARVRFHDRPTHHLHSRIATLHALHTFTPFLHRQLAEALGQAITVKTLGWIRKNSGKSQEY